ncbi:MAG: glycosyltransferase [Acidobacteriota bacterium]
MLESPHISLIIPAWNEALYLPRLLDSVVAARARYRAGAGAIEVLVADNVSTDETARVAAAHDCRVVQVEKRVIGAVRNGGAAVARGAILSFIDADCTIHPETFNAVSAAFGDHRLMASMTGLRFDRWSPGIAATYALTVPLAWITGLDAGVMSCRQGDFQAIGGYNEDRLFAEDVQILIDLRRLGRSRGQRMRRLRGVKAVTSTRKFDRHGDWHMFAMMARAPLALFRRNAVRDTALEYWYQDRISPPSGPAEGAPAPPNAR